MAGLTSQTSVYIHDDIDSTYKNFHIRAEGYNQYAIVGALVFGFGITILVQFDTNDFHNNSILLALFMILMCLVVVLSGVSTMLFILQFYVIKKLMARQKNDGVVKFAENMNQYRVYGRRCVVAAYWSLILAVCMFVIGKFLNDHQYIGIVSAIILICGVLMGSFVHYVTMKHYHLQKT